MKKFLCYTLICIMLAIQPNITFARSKSDTDNARKFESYYGLYPDENLQNKIAQLGDTILKANGINSAEYTFKVINSSEVNAVTLPGGYIYVYKGLIDFMTTEDEIAAVIGHEIGHVTGNHLARRQREQLLTMLLGAILGGAEGAIAANAALVALPAYGQRDEREADDSSFKLMYNAKLNPYAVLVTMHKLGDSNDSKIKVNFAQHPEPLERAKRIEGYLQKMQIKPIVIQNINSATVQEDNWTYIINRPQGNNNPLYRAWLLAGNLYSLSKKPDLSKEMFYTVEQQESIQIYYQDKVIYTINQMDIISKNTTLNKEAKEFIKQLYIWVDLQKTKSNKNQ